MTLIDKDALRMSVREISSVGGCSTIDRDELEDVISDAPTIDAIEVVHAEWIERIVRVGDSGAEDYWGKFCSCCNGESRLKPPYCPNCGAKMDGHKKDVM